MKFLIPCCVIFGITESAIWNIPNEFSTTPKNSNWCYPKGGKWNAELKQCVCYKNYYGSFCEEIKNCRYGSKLNNECLCLYGWKGTACDQIDCKFGLPLDKETCACKPGIGGIYCDSCLKRYLSPPNCLETSKQLIEPKIQQNQHQNQQCSTNLINYYLNIFLFILIAIYFTFNRILKRREQAAMLLQSESRPLLTPEMEALLLAKTHIDPDFIPCPRYDEISHSSIPRQEQPDRITVVEEDESNTVSVNESSIRILSLHV